jgi:hypothetical protein
MISSLDSILSNEKPDPTPAPEAAPAEPAPKEAAAPVEKPEAPKELLRGTDGKFVKPEDAPKPAEKPATPPPQDMTDKERAAFAKAADEARKRQALEQEVAALRAQLQPQAPAEKPKAFWDDPEAALKRHQDEIRQETTTTKLNTAELIARSRHTDFDEKVDVFSEIVRSTPGLAAQWLAAPDPAEFAYTIGKNHLLLKEMGSLDAITAKVRAETEASVRAKVEAEFKAKQEELEKQRAALPPSLSDTRGAPGAGTKPVWSGPTPLADILK